MPEKDTQSPWIDITFFAFVAAFFVFSAHSLTKSRARTEMDAPIADPRAEAKVERAPASVTAGEDSIKTIYIGCLGSAASLATGSGVSLLRLTGEWCGRGTPVSAGGRNESTGAEILAFTRPGTKAFTTSYFPLHAGVNLVSFDLEYAGGKSRRERVEVVRSSGNK